MNPVEDFYTYCNENWLNNTKIPDGYSRWSRFNELSDKVLEQTRTLLDVVDDDRLKTLINKFNGYDYGNEMKFHNNIIKEIDDQKTTEDLFNLYNDKLMLFGISFMYDLGPTNDLKDSNFNVLYLCPACLPLKGREYYLEDQFKDVREKYITFINSFSILTGGKFDGNKILEFETRLAKLHLEPHVKRNPENIYFPKTYEEVLEYNVDADKFYNKLGKKRGKIICTNEKYFDNYLEDTDFKLLQEYLKYRTLLSFCSYASDDIYNLYFDFFGRTLSGTKVQLPKWKRLINILDSTLGELLGKAYVAKYFTESSKETVEEMIQYFIETLNSMINLNKWMEDETKEKALEKLGTIKYKIGYPSKFKTFDNLNLSDCKTLTEVMCKIREWWFYEVGKELYENVDREKWEMLPHQVNAYYHPLLNEIVFPAGILQDPFFDENSSLAKNYGGIGVVIAHEITHGFDDQGRKFDAEGNLKNWWTEKDTEKFTSESNKIVEQFDKLEIYENKVNGKLTLGENLADLGGVRISLEALKRKKRDLSNDEMKEFFESFAKIWANLCELEEGKRLIKIDPHSPGKFRVNGILAHVKDYHKLYDCEPGDEMYLENVCNIWSL